MLLPYEHVTPEEYRAIINSHDANYNRIGLICVATLDGVETYWSRSRAEYKPFEDSDHSGHPQLFRILAAANKQRGSDQNKRLYIWFDPDTDWPNHTNPTLANLYRRAQRLSSN
jgi:hypothetical protein